jgi:hypothetical protein
VPGILSKAEKTRKYLKGIPTGDFTEALAAILGENPSGLVVLIIFGVSI